MPETCGAIACSPARARVPDGRLSPDRAGNPARDWRRMPNGLFFMVVTLLFVWRLPRMVAERTSPLQGPQRVFGRAELMSMVFLMRDMELLRLASLMILILAGVAGHYRRGLAFSVAE